MTSLIAWLDASAEEQRRVREIVQLFSQRDSVDELGGRRIVVAISDALFPGTSVLHTRARYLLFVPWLAKVAAQRKDPAAQFEWLERRLIKSFLDDTSVDTEDRLDGLIGREAGPKVRQLPSTAYWTALDAWGVLLVPGTVKDTLARTNERRSRRPADDTDELAERAIDVWHPGVREPPRGFPVDDIDGGFRLKRHEATWLRERWMETAPGSLLAHLVNSRVSLDGAWAPWLEVACRNAETGIVQALDDAERFSLAMAGARLVYFLLVGERYLEHGFDRVDVGLDDLRNALDDWSKEVTDRAVLFGGWEPAAFWARARTQNARIDEFSRQFFDYWFDRTDSRSSYPRAPPKSERCSADLPGRTSARDRRESVHSTARAPGRGRRSSSTAANHAMQRSPSRRPRAPPRSTRPRVQPVLLKFPVHPLRPLRTQRWCSQGL
jgi:hypothetical protein